MNSPIELVMGIISIVIVIYTIYSNYFKPLKKFKEYIRRAVNYDLIFKREKAIYILNKALEEITDLSNNERFALKIAIGEYYYKDKKYREANNYFGDAIKIIENEKFMYNRSYNKIIESYIYAGDIQEARRLYNHFLLRKSYDINFSKLEKLTKLLY
ncbi:hypothetical protein [Alkaliphilus hydrothermalis]|uniref:Pentatricopeptide repeat protein n=1 Tax=Alkaliphilus hydrothermalis TaxID=1482730 RepID=A0ABS2NU89_9FIRM|nr:hypothetical protein [Alkaliphilus hydrothermalis]MBM7616466.1 pentatricopeptide repeat protein [Alkaliphilus hydrothermalis]